MPTTEHSDIYCGTVPNIGSKPRLLWLGNQLSEISKTRAASEDVVDQLRKRGWTVTSASGKKKPVAAVGRHDRHCANKKKRL